MQRKRTTDTLRDSLEERRRMSAENKKITTVDPRQASRRKFLKGMAPDGDVIPVQLAGDKR